jgi:hypothetical protein
MCDTPQQQLQARLSAHLLMACFDSCLYHLQAAHNKTIPEFNALAATLSMHAQHLPDPSYSDPSISHRLML